jgi:1-acyl-sn-glycerol-3-phosphate acyltransferase
MLLFPAFLFAFFVLYWSLPLTCLSGEIALFRFRGRRDDMFQWARFLVRFFGANIRLVGERTIHRTEEPMIYLHNHRSWADFFLDVYVTEGRAAPLSRWAVFPVLPIVLASGRLLRSVLFFNRTKVADKEAFNIWLERRVRTAFIRGLIVYPEGHRSLEPKGLPFKRGMLHFAYARKWPLQVVITSHKEDLLSEKKLVARWNARLALGFSEPINPASFTDFEAFVAHVKQAWDSTWQLVYSSSEESGRPFVPGAGSDLGVVYPMPILVGQAIIVLASAALLLGLLLVVGRALMSSTFIFTQAAIIGSLTTLSVHAAKM